MWYICTDTFLIDTMNEPNPRNPSVYTHTPVLYTDNDIDLIFNALMDYWLETVKMNSIIVPTPPLSPPMK